MRRRIELARKNLEKAERRLAAVLEAEQAKCRHRRVVETPWQSLEYCGCLNARRICLDCGIEEEGSHWSGGQTWSRKLHDGAPLLGNSPGREVSLMADRDEFYRLRV